ncbi:Zinc finger and SCAN domain-containing protein 5B [Taenia solium]|eukprot:TsM_000525200 transcript=TsM_000525200 gene=TsM_000525200
MQSDVSVLTCTPQSAPQRLPHLMLGLKKEPTHLSTCVTDGSADVKNVFLSHLGTKQSDFYSSSLVQPETHKVPLDSVDTLLRNKSYVEPPSNPDSDLNEFLQFVSERSCFADDKPPPDSSSSSWSPNYSPVNSVLKHEESLKSIKLPTVDQIMKFHSRNPSTSTDVPFPTPSSSSLVEPPFEHSSQFLSSASSVNFAPSGVMTPESPLQSPSSALQAPLQSKYDSESVSVNGSSQLPSHQWRPIIASTTSAACGTTSTKETEQSSQKAQPRFILPNTSRPPFEVSLAKQTLLVPINNPSSGAGSLLLLPLAVAAALQHQKQQQQQGPPSTALLASLPGTGVCGTTQFLLIRTADAPKTMSAAIIPSSKTEFTLPVVTASSTNLINIPSKSEALSPRLPLPPSTTASTTAIGASVKPLAPAVLSATMDILPAPPFAKPVTSVKHRPSPEDSNTVVSAVTTAVSTLRRRHQCPFCTKSCERKDNLQAHIRTHTGERPFPCRFCPKAFPQKDHLRAHIRTHTGEKPYRCPQCSKAFAQLGNLHRHVKTHRQ